MDDETLIGELRQTIELKSIWIMRRQKEAVPDDQAQMHMDNETPNGGGRQSIELRSI